MAITYSLRLRRHDPRARTLGELKIEDLRTPRDERAARCVAQPARKETLMSLQVQDVALEVIAALRPLMPLIRLGSVAR